ncbi:MAG: hypothetical protein O9972_45470, partial [Burkholderiales bacterium]|nr:hypothetical protein [Burkholderiales bacterium]
MNTYKPMLRDAQRLLKDYPDVMLLADRGFANHGWLSWRQVSGWHYCLRLPGDVLVHGVRRHPIEVKYLWPAKGEAILYDQVGLWTDAQGVTKGFKGNQDKDSSQMNPKEIEWLRQPPKISICYHHSIRPVYKP